MTIRATDFDEMSALERESQELADALLAWFAACPKRMTDQERADTIRILTNAVSLSQKLQVQLVDAVGQRLEAEAELVYAKVLARMSSDATLH